MSRLALELAHLIVRDVFMVKVKAVEFPLIEYLFVFYVIDYFIFQHFLADFACYLVVVFGLLEDPVQNLLSHYASLVHGEPAAFEVLHLNLVLHYVCPVF